MKGYGSTNDPTSSPPREILNENHHESTSYSTPHRNRPHTASLPRNESAGGATAQTNESEPLLGEQLLLGNDAAGGPDDIHPGAMFLSPYGADASTIERVGSDHEVDTTSGTTANARGKDKDRTPKQSGSPRKQTSRPESDPRIGLNVVTNESRNELDTLAYSRDPDDSTLLTSDNFTRKYNLLSPFEEGDNKSLLKRFFSKSESTDPPYVLVLFGLAVGIGLCAISFIAYAEFNRYGESTDENMASPDRTWHGVPYTKIGRESFGDPVSNFIDVSLFHPSLLHGGHGAQEGKKYNVPFLRVPFPTGAFWTNLILLPQKPTQARPQQSKNQYSYPIVAYPYSYQWSSLGKLQASYSASRRVMKVNSIQDAFAPDITLGSKEDINTRHVVQFDSLSVTLGFYSSDTKQGRSSSDGNWETYIVQGSPYITAKYSGLTPELTALSDFNDISCPPTSQGESPSKWPKGGERKLQQQEHRLMTSSSTSSEITPTAGKKLGICGISTDSSKQKKLITGVQFVATTKENLTWLIFASEPLTFEFNQGARHVIQSREKYGGVIRLAVVPPPSTTTTKSASLGTISTNSLDGEHLATSSGVKRLIYHAGAYPVRGTVSWDFRSGHRSPLASSASTSSKSHRRTSSSQHAMRHRITAETAPPENNIGRITFSFDTIHMTSASPSTDVPLLMLALPHHAASITTAQELLLHQEAFDLDYLSIKGRMVPVVGSTWSYEEELTFMGFGDQSLTTRTIAQTSSTSLAGGTEATIHESTAISTLDQSVRDLLLQTVASDFKINLPDVSTGAYGFGKQIARMAQLAHIADVVDAANVKEVDVSVDMIKNTTKNTSQVNPGSPSSKPVTSNTATSSTGSGTARRGYALLEKYLTMWLAGDGNDKRLVYDAQLGGILSTEGTEDINADFGNARYNDHHFHYGYILYASAILGRANPKFISQYGPFVDALFYDVAHNNADPKPGNGQIEIFFPLARHKSWYDGHSFASGLFPFANGKSQESSSEAVNCYFGAHLWSQVRWGTGSSANRKIVDYTRLLLATEITGAKTYWHMMPPKDDSSGVGSNSTRSLVNADTTSSVPMSYNSEFRKNYMVGNLGMTDVTCTTWFGTENIYVHLINFMPVTAITAELFNKEYVKGERSVLSNNDSVESAWRGYSICNEAIVDPNNAWIEAQRLISSQLDPGLSKSQVLFWVSTRGGFSPKTTAQLSSQPNDFVGDGDGDEGSTSVGNAAEITKSAKNKSNSLASCTSHEKCVAESLIGTCCPTSTGIFLRCCS